VCSLSSFYNEWKFKRLCCCKSSWWGNRFWDPRKHLAREHEILERFKSLPGIPHLIDFYDESDGLALIKDYIPGRIMRFGQKVTNTQSQCVIEEAVKELHDSGFASFELVPGNIVLSSGVPFLIDLGSAVSLGDWEVSVDDFCRFADNDLRALEKICD